MAQPVLTMYTQPRQLPCARHPVLKSTHLPLSHLFLLAQTLSSKWIATPLALACPPPPLPPGYAESSVLYVNQAYNGQGSLTSECFSRLKTVYSVRNGAPKKAVSKRREMAQPVLTMYTQPRLKKKALITQIMFV